MELKYGSKVFESKIKLAKNCLRLNQGFLNCTKSFQNALFLPPFNRVWPRRERIFLGSSRVP